MRHHNAANEQQKTDKQLTAAEKFVQTIGSLEKAKKAVEALSRLRKAA